MQKLTVAVLLLFSTIYAKAQIINNLGIKSGVVISNQDWDYKSGFKGGIKEETRTGLYIGLTAEILSSNYFSLLADVGYIQKGMQFEVVHTTEEEPEGTGEMKTIDSRYDFITLQPVARLKLPTEKLQPYIFAGPRADFYLGFASNSSYGLALTDVAPVTFGASYGVGINYIFSDFMLSLEGQHQPDFTALYDKKTSPQHLGLSVRNQAFLVSLAFKYRF